MHVTRVTFTDEGCSRWVPLKKCKYVLLQAGELRGRMRPSPDDNVKHSMNESTTSFMDVSIHIPPGQTG